jgi:hypothetical protein
MEQEFNNMQHQLQQVQAALEEQQQQQAVQHQIQQQILQTLQNLQGAPPPFEQEPLPVPEPQPAVPPAAMPTSARLRFSEPEQFSGQRDQYESWKTKALVFVNAHHEIYPQERDKILYIFQRLTGRAYDQMVPIMVTLGTEHEAQELTHLPLALGRMDALFGQINRVEDAAAKLNNLRQKSSERVAEYAAEFQRLLGIVGGGESEAGLCVRFRSGLRFEIATRLVGMPDLGTLQALVSRSIAIDQDLQNNEFLKRWNRHLWNQRSTPSARSSNSEPVPMEIGRMNLTEQERQRRIENRLCFKCGKPNHLARNCRAQVQPSARAAVASTSATPEFTPEQIAQILARLNAASAPAASTSPVAPADTEVPSAETGGAQSGF